jgi:hypothetical protein
VLKLVPPMAGALLAVFILLPATASAGPLGACWKSQLDATAEFALAVSKCLDKNVTRGKNFPACSSRNQDEFVAEWRSAVKKAAKKNADCGNGSSHGDIAAFVQSLILAADVYVVDSLSGSPSLKLVNTFRGQLAKAVGDYALKLFEAEADNAKKEDVKGLAKARRKSAAEFQDRWAKFVKQARKKGLDFAGVVTVAEADLLAEIAAVTAKVLVGTPPPPKIVHDDNGIKIRVKRGVGDQVAIKWDGCDLKKKVDTYLFEEWVGGSYVITDSTDKCEHGDTPIQMPVVDPDAFCIRVVGEKASGAVVGRGKSGNAPPCT